MALPFEELSAEELGQERMERFRARTSWEKNTTEQRMHLRVASQLQATKEMLEDLLLKVKPATVVIEGKEEQLAAMRQEISRTEDMYMQLQVYAVYGSRATEELYGKPKMSGKLPAELEKKLDKFLKDRQEK